MVTMDLSTWQGMRARDPPATHVRQRAMGHALWCCEPIGSPSDASLRACSCGLGTRCTRDRYGASVRTGGAAHRCDSARLPSAEGWRVITKLDANAHEPGLGIAETLERVSTSLSESRLALRQDGLPVVFAPSLYPSSRLRREAVANLARRTRCGSNRRARRFGGNAGRGLGGAR